MQQEPLHRLYHHYSEMPYSQRFLYTATLLILGGGYLFALLNVYFTYAGKAGGNPLMLSYQDIVVAYSGSGKGSRLESALLGPMSTMLPPDERGVMIAWANEGAKQPSYEKDVKPMLDRRCMACHDGSNPHLPNFSTYENLKKVTEKDTGATLATLVRVSHIHLFGLTFIFFLMGSMFTHAYATGLAQMRDCRGPVRRHRAGCELLVLHQDLQPVRLGGDWGGGLMGPALADVADHHVSAGFRAAARDGEGTGSNHLDPD